MEILTRIHQSPMSWFQRRTVALALAIYLMDGFDIAVMAFAAPALSNQWSINPVTLGYLLSASLFGMAAGAIFLTPMADRIGRRALLLLSLGIVCVGMIASVFSPDVPVLIAARIITGIGVGCLSATINVLVAEFSSDRRRATMAGIYSVGFPIGASICGVLSASLIPQFGWQSIFLVGAVASIVLLVLAFFYLPESLDFLLNKRPANALEKTNSILAKMGHPTIASLPQVPERQTRKGMAKEIFIGSNGFRTIMLWAGYGFLTAGYYFLASWTPKIISSELGNTELGVTMGTLTNAGGIVGCLAFGAAALILRNRTLLIIALLGAGVFFVVFAFVIHATWAALAVATIIGFLIAAALTGFYALSPEMYSAQNRVTGTGWMLGVGRLVSIVGPILVGYLIADGWGAASIFPLFGVVLSMSALAVIAISVSLRGKKATLVSTTDHLVEASPQN